MEEPMTTAPPMTTEKTTTEDYDYVEPTTSTTTTTTTTQAPSTKKKKKCKSTRTPSDGDIYNHNMGEKEVNQKGSNSDDPTDMYNQDMSGAC